MATPWVMVFSGEGSGDSGVVFGIRVLGGVVRFRDERLWVPCFCLISMLACFFDGDGVIEGL